VRWVEDFQLFLLDFDGLLVNTEELHFQAYKNMCANRGVELNWSFDRYCQAAHYSSDMFRQQIYAEFPQLQAQEPHWPVLYAEKKQALLDLVEQGAVHLMPGAEHFLRRLEATGRNRCVVTNSPKELIGKLQSQLPALQTIPHWITREFYTHPKPDPECYLKAIEKFATPGDRIIGFEDTPRGMRALISAGVQAVMISQAYYPEIPEFLKVGALHFPSLEAMQKDLLN
jgi:HAD superfamily hydrolase (TIGR01509 family)